MPADPPRAAREIAEALRKLLMIDQPNYLWSRVKPLVEYADHLQDGANWCERWVTSSEYDGSKPCTCGLDELLAEWRGA